MAIISDIADHVSEHGVGRGGAGGREAGGRATEEIQPDLVGEGDRRRLAAVLAADAEDETGPRLPPEPARGGDELADTGAVEHLERVGGEDPLLRCRGGGDAPGINAAARAGVRVASATAVEVVVVRCGYRGLPDSEIVPLESRGVTGFVATKSDRNTKTPSCRQDGASTSRWRKRRDSNPRSQP
jgi:hypothetical protein